MRPPTNARNRVISAIVVGGAHVAVLCLIWKFHFARDSAVEEFGTIFFFSPGATVSRRTQGIRNLTLRLRPILSQDLSELPSTPVFGEAVPATSSSPSAPGTLDWQQALESVAGDVMEQAKTDAARSARFRKPQPSASFEPLHERPHDFEWISEHSRLVINAQGVPQWVLVQPCAVNILLRDPDCIVEHIERQGITFEYMQQQHDATLAYGGPNAVP
jgi:hypothetical protein